MFFTQRKQKKSSLQAWSFLAQTARLSSGANSWSCIKTSLELSKISIYHFLGVFVCFMVGKREKGVHPHPSCSICLPASPNLLLFITPMTKRPGALSQQRQRAAHHLQQKTAITERLTSSTSSLVYFGGVVTHPEPGELVLIQPTGGSWPGKRSCHHHHILPDRRCGDRRLR